MPSGLHRRTPARRLGRLVHRGDDRPQPNKSSYPPALRYSSSVSGSMRSAHSGTTTSSSQKTASPNPHAARALARTPRHRRSGAGRESLRSSLPSLQRSSWIYAPSPNPLRLEQAGGSMRGAPFPRTTRGATMRPNIAQRNARQRCPGQEALRSANGHPTPNGDPPTETTSSPMFSHFPPPPRHAASSVMPPVLDAGAQPRCGQPSEYPWPAACTGSTPTTRPRRTSISSAPASSTVSPTCALKVVHRHPPERKIRSGS